LSYTSEDGAENQHVNHLDYAFTALQKNFPLAFSQFQNPALGLVPNKFD
jgi:hypothetical protein